MYKKLSIVAVIMVFIIGCGSLPPTAEENYDFEQNSVKSKTQMSEKSDSFSGKDRFLTYKAYYRIKSMFPDSVHMSVVNLTEKFEGYVLDAAKDETTIRIISKYLGEVIEEIESLGEIIEKNIDGTDITEKYYDLEIRLENAEKTRQRYLELMKKAGNIKEIMMIERELERINKDIDLLRGKINNLQHKIKYATITVRTSPGVKAGPVGWVFVKLYNGVKSLFVR